MSSQDPPINLRLIYYIFQKRLHARVLQTRQFSFPGEKARSTPRSSPAVPPGISADLLQEVCRQVFARPYHSLHYSALSGVYPWKKAACVYRVFLGLDNGKEQSLIYKSAVYTDQEASIFHGLPVIPGPIELEFYRCVSPPFSQYVPDVYYIDACESGERYQLLLEDLSPAYHTISDPLDIIHLIERLPEFHLNLQRALHSVSTRNLLIYDHSLMLGITENMDEMFFAYFSRKRKIEIPEFELAWPVISRILRTPWVFEHQPLQYIHGDLHLSKIFVYPKDHQQFKLIDWQLAGLGIPQMDLATCLKGVHPIVEREAISRYEKQLPGSSARINRKIYAWCKLLRYVIDAAYMTIECTDEPSDSSIRAVTVLEKSLQRAIMAFVDYQRLEYRKISIPSH